MKNKEEKREEERRILIETLSIHPLRIEVELRM
jgi:hypothetical protein